MRNCNSFLLTLLALAGTTRHVASWSVNRRFGASTRPTRLWQSTTANSPTASKTKIVVVGGGIGGLSSAFDARKHIGDEAEITVISAREQFQFTPSNPWIAVRKRKPEDISLNLSNILPKHDIIFRHDEVVHLDPKSNQLKLKGGDTVKYDYLIVATGPKLAFDEIPGMRENSKSICETPHASHAADALDQLMANPGPVVVGAVQGSSCFGPAYEFALILHHVLIKKGGQNLAQQCPITFITPEPYLGHLGLKGAGDSQKILEKSLKKANIDWLTNCSVKKITKDSITVELLEGDKKTTKTLPSLYTMLIPRFHGHSVWKVVPGLTDSVGMLLCNDHQQSFKYPNIFGVGVAVHIDSLEKTPIATGAPKTGYMIESMGTAAVKNMKAMIEYHKEHPNEKINEESIPLPFKPTLNGLCITDFGNDGAIFLTIPQLPPRRADYTIYGRVATLAKLAFEKYFLMKIETGDTDPYYEKYMLHLVGVDRDYRGT